MFLFFSFLFFSSLLVEFHGDTGETHVISSILLYNYSSTLLGYFEPCLVLQGLEGYAKNLIEKSVN